MPKLDESLASLAEQLRTPALDAEFARRVQTIARAEFVADAAGLPRPAALRFALSGAVVPTLLVSAAAVTVVDDVTVIAKIYAPSQEQ